VSFLKGKYSSLSPLLKEYFLLRSFVTRGGLGGLEGPEPPPSILTYSLKERKSGFDSLHLHLPMRPLVSPQESSSLVTWLCYIMQMPFYDETLGLYIYATPSLSLHKSCQWLISLE
jgi:hypothetical protein